MFAKGEGYHVMICHVYLHVLYQDVNNGGAVQVAPWPKGMDLDRDTEIPFTKIHETTGIPHIAFEQKQ